MLARLVSFLKVHVRALLKASSVRVDAVYRCCRRWRIWAARRSVGVGLVGLGWETGEVEEGVCEGRAMGKAEYMGFFCGIYVESQLRGGAGGLRREHTSSEGGPSAQAVCRGRRARPEPAVRSAAVVRDCMTVSGARLPSGECSQRAVFVFWP